MTLEEFLTEHLGLELGWDSNGCYTCEGQVINAEYNLVAEYDPDTGGYNRKVTGLKFNHSTREVIIEVE